MTLVLLAFLQAPASAPASAPAAWPTLSSRDKDAAKEAIFSLKRARTDDRVAELKEQIRPLGKGVVPMLIEALRKAEPEPRARVESLLDVMTGPEDATLLANEFASKDPGIRLWVVRRCARYGDRTLAPRFEKLLGDPDKEVAFAAALGCCRAGSFAAFESLQKTAEADWAERAPAVVEALSGLRGPEATAKLLPGLASTKPMDMIASLRLLAGAGEKSAIPTILPFLDSTDLRVKLEAVNALRGILDGAPPLVKPSSFDLIEHVNKWKDRLGVGR